MSRFGRGEESELKATPQIQEIARKMKKQVEDTLGKKFKTFKAVRWIQQGYNGVNYKIKVEVDKGSYIHIIIEDMFWKEGNQLSLSVITEGKTLQSPLISWG